MEKPPLAILAAYLCPEMEHIPVDVLFLWEMTLLVTEARIEYSNVGDNKHKFYPVAKDKANDRNVTSSIKRPIKSLG